MESSDWPQRNIATSHGAALPCMVWRGLLFGLILASVTIFVYRPAWNGGFLWDDDVYIANNELPSAAHWQRVAKCLKHDEPQHRARSDRPGIGRSGQFGRGI
jgi:hypothetical protein